MFSFLKRLGIVFLFLLIFSKGVLAQSTAFSLKWPLTDSASGSRVSLSGKVGDVYTEAEREAFKLSLYYIGVTGETGITPFVSGVYDTVAAYESSVDNPGKKSQAKFDVAGHTLPVGLGTGVGVHPSTGEYTFALKDLSPNTTYYYAQVAELGGKVEVRAGQFDSSKGHMTQTEKESDFEKRSYRLLSPLPGLAVFLDPDLCVQMLNEGKKVPSLCTREDPSGFNGFLNYAFKLLIGLSATLLVLRIIFEGYQYVMTDVPFLKSSAKSKLWQSVLGLLLALSAYLILNTINPKLVTNKIEINSLTLTVEEEMLLNSLGIAPNSPEAKALSPEDIKRYKISFAGTKEYIKKVYIPERDKALPDASKALKALMTSHMYVEGFFPGSMADRTNNPGNIGNMSGSKTGGGARTCYASLGDGIKRQYQHFLGVAKNTNPNYKIGARRDGPLNTKGQTLAVAPNQRLFETLSSNYLTGYYAFIYDGSLWQYLYIYSPETTDKRKVYLSGVLSYLTSEGIAATHDTKVNALITANDKEITRPSTIPCGEYAWTGKK